jgi:hypothetical protein
LRVAAALARTLPTHLRFFYLSVVESMWPDDVRGSSTWRSLQRMARDVGCSWCTAQRNVDALVQRGFLRREWGGHVTRDGRVVKGSTARTPKLVFVANPERERATRDARHAERRAAADAERARRADEFAALHERRVRLQAAVETGKVPLVDAAAEWDALKTEERALERSCGYTWNRNTMKAEQRRARKRTPPTLAGKPRADAQFVRPDTVRAAVEGLAVMRPAAPGPTAAPGACAKCGEPHAPNVRCWFYNPPVQCNCGAVVVRHPRTGAAFAYVSHLGAANPRQPHTCR